MGLAVVPYHVARWVTRALPRPAAFRLAQELSDMQYRVSASDRAGVQSNLSVLTGRPVGEWSPEVRDVFRNFGGYLTEFLLAQEWGEAAFRIEGREELLDAISRHRGTILLSAHIGNWELGGLALGWRGVPVSAVALTHRDPAVDRLFTRQRERAGARVIPLNAHATRQCLERLRAGGVVCLLGDRDFATPGLPMPCFGRRLAVPRGPALLSVRTGAPLVPVWCIRQGPQHLKFYVEPPILPPGGGDLSEQVVRMMRAYVEALERVLRRFPTQWLMFRPRFEDHVQRDAHGMRHHPRV